MPPAAQRHRHRQRDPASFAFQLQQPSSSSSTAAPASTPAFAPAFAARRLSSTSSASNLSGSGSGSGQRLDERAEVAPFDPSACDAPGLPRSESLLFDEDMTAEGENSAGFAAVGDNSHAPLPMSMSASAQDSFADETFSAFMSVPHYPEATNEQTRISVSEIVNAVIEPTDFYRRQNISSHNQDAAHAHAESQTSSADLYMSDSEMTDALSDVGGVPLDGYQMEQTGMGLGMGMTGFASQFFDDAVAHQHYSAPSESTEDDRDRDRYSGTDMVMEYESQPQPQPQRQLQHQRQASRRGTVPLATPEDDDDTRKFYLDHGDSDGGDGAYNSDVESRASADSSRAVSDVDLDDFYRAPGYTYGSQVSGFDPPSSHEDHVSFFSDVEDTNADPAADPHLPDSVIHGTTQERNHDIDQFIIQWICQSTTASVPMFTPVPPVTPQHNFLGLVHWTPPEKVSRPSGFTGNFFDIQQIPWWEKLRVRRSDARQLRDQSYTSYHNLQQYPRQRTGFKIPEEEFYFQGKSMYTRHKATIEHFQLRNLMSVPAYNTLHFARESKVYSWVPAYNDLQCLIDLSVPAPESGFQGPVKISTMKTAAGVTIAGGFFGEYSIRGMGNNTKAEGYVTKDSNGITNHIDIIPSRTSRSPIGVFASNDRHVRTLDCETDTFLTDHELTHAVNCTSTSPDGRLRVIVGDSPDAWVVEADTGRPVHPLRGHRDFGFACAWSPDMMQIATSNQDKSAIIWDARTWRPLEKIESDVAGYRSLRFSPVGGGPRTLLLTEPADRIVVLNAQTYKSRQVHDFFGEIGGADYAPDGSAIWVANTDEHFGGFMEFERRQWGQQFGLAKNQRDSQSQIRGPNEWVREADLDSDERCVLSERERQSRWLRNLDEEGYEELLLA